MSETNKTLKIVFSDNGKNAGKGFNLYLDGDTDGIEDIPEDKMTPAQYYGSKLFEVCKSALEEAGILLAEKSQH